MIGPVPVIDALVTDGPPGGETEEHVVQRPAQPPPRDEGGLALRTRRRPDPPTDNPAPTARYRPRAEGRTRPPTGRAAGGELLRDRGRVARPAATAHCCLAGAFSGREIRVLDAFSSRCYPRSARARSPGTSPATRRADPPDRYGFCYFGTPGAAGGVQPSSFLQRLSTERGSKVQWNSSILPGCVSS